MNANGAKKIQVCRCRSWYRSWRLEAGCQIKTSFEFPRQASIRASITLNEKVVYRRVLLIFLMSAMPAPVLPAQKTRVQVSAASGAALERVNPAHRMGRVKYNNPGLPSNAGF